MRPGIGQARGESVSFARRLQRERPAVVLRPVPLDQPWGPGPLQELRHMRKGGARSRLRARRKARRGPHLSSTPPSARAPGGAFFASTRSCRSCHARHAAAPLLAGASVGPPMSVMHKKWADAGRPPFREADQAKAAVPSDSRARAANAGMAGRCPERPDSGRCGVPAKTAWQSRARRPISRGERAHATQMMMRVRGRGIA